MKYLAVVCVLACSRLAGAQSIALPWSGHAHDAQHSNISKVASQPLQQVRWTTPVDMQRRYSGGGSLLAHYGSPLITRGNTVLIPVKVTADSFRVEARDPANGSLKWMQTTDYSLPTHDWVPPYGIALTPKNRLYFAGAGGTAYFRDAPDETVGVSGQQVFYGLAQYQSDPALYNARVKINTPITSDRYGNIFFGFQVTGGANPAGLESGLARIAEDGTGSWVFARTAADDGSITKVLQNCAPALSNDQKTLYFAVSTGDYGAGYLVALDSRTLARVAKIRLKDVLSPSQDAILPDDGSTSPTVGPDGDVYFGVLENFLGTNNYRGWLLHFDGALTQRKTCGAFGWDDTASIVPSSLVPSYTGSSPYLLLTKYNNYAGAGGDGVNRLALLDPNNSMIDPISGATVMAEVMKIACPTPDHQFPNVPGAVREWCINTAAIDPFTKSVLASAEDGILYRWDFITNTLSETLPLTDGIGEAYTPTMIGVDGTVYSIANGILFASGAATP